jgi:hypothetical protein
MGPLGEPRKMRENGERINKRKKERKKERKRE